MINFPLAPGAYVDELNLLSLNIGLASTAVPVFVVGASTVETWWAEYQKPILVPSFAEYQRYIQNIQPQHRDNSHRYGMYEVLRFTPRRRNQGPAHWPTFAKLMKSDRYVRNNSTNTDGEMEWGDSFAPALKAYFDNGGGYCYLCPYDKIDSVLDMPDVTMLVQGGQQEAKEPILKVCVPGSGLFGLLDGPEHEGPFNKEASDALKDAATPSDCVAMYYPWLKADWRLYNKEGMPVETIHLVAPSAVVAGVICAVDSQIGPWKAPANVPLKGGLRPAVKIGNKSQAEFTHPGKTEVSVNMIREFEGRGTQIWGARTLTISGNAWAYIPVRRTFDMAERDISTALESVLFEPNGQATWEVVRGAIDNYLYNLYLQGAFSGTTPAESYFVQIGRGVTMSRGDIDAGILRVRVGMAVVRPAEFIILEFTQQVASGV